MFTRFLRAAREEALALQAVGDHEIDIIYEIDGHADNEDYQKLIADVRRRRLAGIVFMGRVDKWALQSPLFESNDVPKIHTGAPLKELGVSGIKLDPASFFDQALDHFAAAGRRRVALVHGPLSGEIESMIRRGLQVRGMETKPYWWHRIAVSTPESARSVSHLLMRLPEADRPDALLITDDNAVEQATAGLLAGGVSVPDELHVVAHCNFPWPAPSIVPVARLGYDTREMLRRAIQTLDDQRRQQTDPREIRLPATWECDPAVEADA